MLGALGGLAQTLQGHAVLAQVDPVLGFEAVREVADDARVDVLATQEAVAGRRLDLVHALVQVQERNVEGATAEIVDRDLGLGDDGEPAVSQGRGGGLVDNALDVEAGDAPGVLGGLALAVAEVGRNRDHGVDDRLAQVFLGDTLHLVEDVGGNLRRRIALVLHADPGVAVVRRGDLVGGVLAVALDFGIGELAAHQSLDRRDRVFRVGHRLAFGDLAHQRLALAGERDYRRRGSRTLGVGDDQGLQPLDDGDARVGRAQVDADDAAHGV